jgi:hypothetical protein
MAFTKWNKETIQSDIFYKPDKWFKIWFYIINEVNWKDSNRLNRWEWWFTYEMIMSATWATRNQVYKCIKRMKISDMIETHKRIRWFDLNVLKYNKFQDEWSWWDAWETHESNSGAIVEADTITKEWRMNNEKEVYRSFKHLSISEQEVETIKEKWYSLEQIDQILDSIENYKWNKKYSSLYLTANNRIKKENPVQQKPKIRTAADIKAERDLFIKQSWWTQ